jgi:nucleotide-binding universal stress UspA family protein
MMLPIKTILHPTDFSPCSAMALELAGSLARDYRARLVVLHVGRPPLRRLGGPAPVPPLAEEWGREELARKLRRLAAPALEPAPEYRVEFADSPADDILRVADEIGSDLVVLGTHGRTGLGRVLMGSVAEQVVRRAGCPVLTVRHLPPGEGSARE